MTNILQSDWTTLKASFQLNCDLADVTPIKSGHINETFFLNDEGDKWVLQQVK